MQRQRTRLLLPLVLVTLLGVTACSGGDEGAADDDVATLGGGDDAAADDASDDDGGSGGGQGGRGVSQEFQDALLEFAECMRDHGVDMPDPEVSADGGVSIAIGAGGAVAAGPASEAEMAEVEEAQEACQPIMDAVEADMPRPDPEQIQEMQDQALAFAECMREHGIDMPDPTFGEEGRIEQSLGGPDGPGFDPMDEDFQEAQEACAEEGGPGGPGVVVGGPAIGSTSSEDG